MWLLQPSLRSRDAVSPFPWSRTGHRTRCGCARDYSVTTSSGVPASTFASRRPRHVLCDFAPAGMEIALLNDPEKQLFERGRRVVDRHVFAAVAMNHVTDLFDRRGAEIAHLDLGHVLDRQQVGDPADLLELAAMQDRDPIANVLHVRQQVARQDDRLPLFTQLADQLLDLGRPDRVQARGRLVEQDQLGVVDQGLCQPDAALHALGVFAKLPMFGAGQADHVDQPADPLVPLGRRILNRRP